MVDTDRELMRNYYRSKGYADATVRSANAEYDPGTKGFALTFTIDEGPLYHFGDISVDCHVDGVDREKLRRLLLVKAGAQFDGTALDKSNDSAFDRTGEARLSLCPRRPAPRATQARAAST